MAKEPVEISNSFQNRLVGTVVLVALVVIFLPSVLDGKKAVYKEQFQSIPAAPQAIEFDDLDSFPEQEYQALIAEADDEIVDEIAIDADEVIETELVEPTTDNVTETETETETASNELEADTASNELETEVAVSEPVIEEETSPDSVEPEEVVQPTSQFERPGWVIQLGSFKHKKNVEKLLGKLRREGYLVFTKPIETSAGKLTKVYVGPDLDKAKLEAMLPALNKTTRLSGKIAPYSPID